MEKREPIIVRCVSTASQITIIIIKTPPDIFSFHIFNITQNNSAGACVRACVGVISPVKPPYVSKQTQKKEKEKRNLLLDLFQVNGFLCYGKERRTKKNIPVEKSFSIQSSLYLVCIGFEEVRAVSKGMEGGKGLHLTHLTRAEGFERKRFP